jgi:hypothetical protein
MLSRFATLGSGLGPPDPYWANVSYLLVGNGANGTTTNIVDSSSNHLSTTVNGNTVISTTQSKFGSGSVSFDGAGDFVGTPSNAVFGFGTGDFTIEAWVYLNSYTSGFGAQIAGTHTWIVGCDFLFVVLTSGNLYLQLGNSPAGALSSTSTVPLGAWTYVAVKRSSGTVTFYINNSSAGSASYATNVPVTYPFDVGSDSTGNNNASLNGYLYDVRVTKGVARTITSAPTAPFPTYGP